MVNIGFSSERLLKMIKSSGCVVHTFSGNITRARFQVVACTAEAIIFLSMLGGHEAKCGNAVNLWVGIRILLI